YKYRGLSSYTAKNIAGVDFAIGQEKVGTIRTYKEEKLEGRGFDKGQAHASYVTFFRVPDNELYDQFQVYFDAL
ncbi:18907_t:CDS:1, partial [Gigaspora rosea]